MASPLGNTSVATSAGSDVAPAPADPQSLQAILDNYLAPAGIRNVELHGARYTRRSLLDHIIKPLVEAGSKPTSTLGDVVNHIGIVQAKLDRLGIFVPESFDVFLADSPEPPLYPGRTEIDLSFKVKERSRLALGAGTDFGNTEGSAYTNVELRNIFGGAETLNVNARTGTRTRSAYNAVLSAPVNGNPDIRLSAELQQSATQKPWASHEEDLTGTSLRLAWQKPETGDTHAFSLSNIWRQVTGLTGSASPTVRLDAGDTLKNSLTYTFTRDRYDRVNTPSPTLPQRGYFTRVVGELAGWGPLKGDVSFLKTEVELSATNPVSLPGIKEPTGVTFGGGFRAGLLYPLPTGYSVTGSALPSRINDRFQLGGPTDVRGFKIGGLGPHDGVDAVGGDVYAAGGVNMMFPLPRGGPTSPLRFQVFANSGRLVAIKNKSSKSKESLGMDSATVSQGVRSAVGELTNSLPSTAVGVGLVYAHPVARFELNFSLPLILRRGEEGRKGLQVGVGINFL
ncbi:hypothetical protein OQA88_7512 [Cercophora sp. LCS_1]